MSDKVNDAISTLMRVVPTRFSGEVAVIKAEIERLSGIIQVNEETVSAIVGEEVLWQDGKYESEMMRLRNEIKRLREEERNGENQR